MVSTGSTPTLLFPRGRFLAQGKCRIAFLSVRLVADEICDAWLRPALLLREMSRDRTFFCAQRLRPCQVMLSVRSHCGDRARIHRRRRSS